MDWLILILIIGVGVLAVIRRKNVYHIQSKNINSFYFSRIALSILVPVLLIVLNPGLLSPPNFELIGKAYLPAASIVSIVLSIFAIPLVLALVSVLKIQETGPPDKRSIFGLPINLLPKNYVEFFAFSLFLLAGVIAEELIFRQFAFHALYNTFGLQGGILVIAAAMLFSIGHAYQGVRGLISSFVIGVIIGIVYLLTESILYPIAMHFIYNATILVPAYRQIKNKEPEDES